MCNVIDEHHEGYEETVQQLAVTHYRRLPDSSSPRDSLDLLIEYGGY